ncbi:carbonic anhydrase [Myroides marinus]|uniref:carbonic anhydrase n=1 Tax=Myroides marinus TaxID=703342 RepID=UPI002576A60E|nr:carbonic anhydrase [Myroides marinus]MDM1369573.1 carbonic anhydrase [Myroides marinus]MDM1372793.1 carbonic anhydrase [Myroides marinus]MDM1376296.1 carbonic anhydrase [Myroides marinus]MDM1382110.1 carbonic anhydrase [Myroides marinus]MDM1391650.1 carbonic anhydrase [Myroides marinus]
MNSFTKEILANTTPAQSLELLLEGNNRFVNNLKFNRNFLHQLQETKDGQHPHAVILSCMDSRAPLEHVLDQGIGDIFSLRIAGNVLTDEVIGSMEYACNVVGSKLIMVLGHSRCGAVTGACNHTTLGKLDTILERIHPVVDKVKAKYAGEDISPSELVELVTVENVRAIVQQLQSVSPSLTKLIAEEKIGVVGAYYDVVSGKVELIC